MMNRVAGVKQSDNHSSGSKSFLQQQHELAEQRGHSVDRVELFKETHAQGGQFVSQVVVNAHVSLCNTFVLFCTFNLQV